MYKKQTFILLEILIAIALISATMLPFLRHPLLHMRKELEILFEMDLERIAQNKMISLHEQLQKGQIPKEIIFSENKQEKPIEQTIICTSLGKEMTRKYEETVHITACKQKKTQDQKMHSLIHFTIKYRQPGKKKTVIQIDSDAVAQKKI